VVENAKYDAPRGRAEPMAFLPLLQQSADEDADAVRTHFIRTIEIRAQADPALAATAVRQALAAADPTLPIFGMRTLSSQVQLAVNPDRLVAILAGFFGAVALALTCVGLYGVTAYSVEQRTREIGIRVALGAKRATVVRMIVREVSFRGALGALFGIPAALLALRAIASALYGVNPADFRYSSAAGLVLVASMLAAAYVPARRASRIEPVEALRHE
jgi:predicted lysophospholipase L1 biosynthesis ABC-type transport system permease subunit